MIYVVRTVLFLTLFLSHPPLQAAQQKSKPTICLNMIVKNESAVICRCLKSVLPIIDYWVIVDTGSTDGTQEIIKNFMKENNIEGELHERPWVNFGHNRNEALKLTKGKSDYVFFIDADEYLDFEPEFKLPELDKDYYYITVSYGGTKYGRNALINNRLNWQWVGVLHEVVCCPDAKTHGNLEKVYNIVVTDGARSKDPLKYEKDAALLESALIDEPNNSRYVFYLAQSYLDCSNYPKALENYEKRIKMGGWDQEVFYSMLKIGNILENMEKPRKEIVRAYIRAYKYRSTRAEPLYFLTHYYRVNQDYASGYKVGKLAQTIPLSQDVLFVQHWIWDFGLPLELSICAYWTGRYEECQQICLELLKKESLPPNFRTCVETNLGFANAKLLEKALEDEDDDESLDQPEQDENKSLENAA